MKKSILLSLLLLSSVNIIRAGDEALKPSLSLVLHAEQKAGPLAAMKELAVSDPNPPVADPPKIDPHKTAEAIAEDDAWIREQLTPRLRLVSEPFPLPRKGSYDDSKEYQFSEEREDGRREFVRSIEFKREGVHFYSLSLYAGITKGGGEVIPPGCSHSVQVSLFPSRWNHYSSRDKKRIMCNNCFTILKSLEQRDREERQEEEQEAKQGITSGLYAMIASQFQEAKQ